jgi:hypothetical protein
MTTPALIDSIVEFVSARDGRATYDAIWNAFSDEARAGRKPRHRAQVPAERLQMAIEHAIETGALRQVRNQPGIGPTYELGKREG